MGEGRRDRSSNRERGNFGIDKSSSDSEVARRSNVNKNQRRGKSKRKERWRFVEGLTVDELRRYRRRRIENYPRETLATFQRSEVRENLMTEYRRAFRATSEDSILKALNNKIGEKTDHSQAEEKIIEPINIEPEAAGGESLKIDEYRKMGNDTEGSQNGGAAILSTRPALIRRGTSLKREGNEFYGKTEYSSYVPHEGHRRADLARRPTSLRMEGEMGTTTEQCEKFIEWLNVSRPTLTRLPTNLKLEGDLETTTENLEKYVPFVGARRPELLRQRANLRLEGESIFLPEYKDVFRPPKMIEKRTPVLPETHLQTGGVFYDGKINSRVDDKMDEQVSDERENEESRKKKEREEEKRRRKEEDMKILVSKLEDLKGPPLEIPEYKDAYKDFPRERPRLIKPEDEIGRADGSKISSIQTPIKFQTKIDQDPEYNSKLSCIDRPVYRKPPLCLKPSAPATTSGLDSHREYRTNEATSEIRSQYIPYGNLPRVETLRMPANLRLEGHIDLQPEYREAYCTRRSGALSNEPRMHRHRDRSSSESRRHENLWTNNDNGEQFGRINAADQQDAFQVLNTRIHEDNIVAKPPLETRRSSRLSVMSGSTLTRPTELNLTTNPLPISRHRSSSPGYRLHVQNFDNEPRGFSNKRTNHFSQQYSQRYRNNSEDRLDQFPVSEERKSYSPSFGKIPIIDDENNDNAFVVLDNAGNDNSVGERIIEDKSKNLIYQNTDNNNTGFTRVRTKNSPTNWMPPWYDNTKTN